MFWNKKIKVSNKSVCDEINRLLPEFSCSVHGNSPSNDGFLFYLKGSDFKFYYHHVIDYQYLKTNFVNVRGAAKYILKIFLEKMELRK